MEGDTRRKKIMEILQQKSQPVSGTELAGMMGVSRQIIVQDIALLRTSYKNILSTNKGYLLYESVSRPQYCRRSFKVKHGNEEIRQELNLIVDAGARVLDVVVEHNIYGQIMVDLIINNRTDVDAFVRQVEENKTKPLNELTDGVHFHTIEAEREEILDEVEKRLKEAGFLL
ncbi:MAG: transcription repressor NadR [Lachnospiraceae bacterium]|nr:transcription repressor NadR [Lachnospiraceae bacterium]